MAAFFNTKEDMRTEKLMELVAGVKQLMPLL